MNNLSEIMQARLDKWRSNATPVKSASQVRHEKTSRRNGKGDFGDVMSMDDWEDEALRSQTRR